VVQDCRGSCAGSALISWLFSASSRGVEETKTPSAWPPPGLKALIRRADKGDASALSVVREYYDNHPELWEHVGNIAASAEHHLLSIGFEGSVRREAISRKLRTLGAELAGPSPTPSERLLVERVVACWLHVNYADGIYLCALESQASSTRLE